jgi:hypothetical protein
MQTITVQKACAAALVACAALAGCSGTHVTTDYDRKANFARYRTYALQRGHVVEQDAPHTRDTLVEDRIVAAIQQELATKGLQPAPDQAHADLIATYTAGARTKQELQSTWDGGYWGPGFDDWYWGGAGYGDVWIEEYREGTLVIDLIDAQTKKLVWRAIAKAENKNFRSAEYIDKAVDKAMDKYPPVPGTSSAKTQ